MDTFDQPVDLSIIVPVLNEAGVIGAFLWKLAAQREINFQVVVCDGGSTDGTPQEVMALRHNLPYSLILLGEEKGRARQMNAGARSSCGRYLLFLHADSSFTDPCALAKACTCLREAEHASGSGNVAAHFSLCFSKNSDQRRLFYYFSECKARLDRPGCTHGDQGFLVNRVFFARAGCFDQSCGVMEGTRFAETVRATGQWVLIPVELITSSRRFETEGRLQRQVLNLIIMTLDAVGRQDFLNEIPSLYAEQSMAGRLHLFPFLNGIHTLTRKLTIRDWKMFWLSVGTYVCNNAWQIPYYFDVRRSFRRGLSAGQGTTPCLAMYDRRLHKLVLSRIVAVSASGLSFFLFHGVRFVTRIMNW